MNVQLVDTDLYPRNSPCIVLRWGGRQVSWMDVLLAL